MKKLSIHVLLPALLCALLAASAGAQETFVTLAREEIEKLVPTLSPAVQAKARACLETTDPFDRALKLRGFIAHAGWIERQKDEASRDFASVRFFLAVIAGEPDAKVRARALEVSGADSYIVAYPPFEGFLARIVETESEPELVKVAYQELRSMRGTRDLAVLGKRVDAARAAGGTAPAWLEREHETAYHMWLGVMAPQFLFEPPPLFAAVPASTPIRILAFGDWGTGKPEQYRIAKVMRDFHARMPFTFGITLGDNFYSTERGPMSPSSARWQTDYEQPYGVMGIPFYVALGNHEYQEQGDLATVEYAYTFFSKSKTWRMPASYYSYTAGAAQFFVIDFQEGKFLTDTQLKWLERELEGSQARWKIVYCHFPLYLATAYTANPEVRRRILPVLRKHGVDLYMNGHHHSMQHWQVDGTDFVTSGAGGAHTYWGETTEQGCKRDAQCKFTHGGYGFSVLDIDDDTLRHRFIGEQGQVLNEFIRRNST